MNAPNRLVIVGLALASTVAMGAYNGAVSAGSAEQNGSTQGEHQALLCAGEPCGAVARGALAFVDRDLHGLVGNGRSCADCHMPADQFQLSPASVEARFQFLRLIRRWIPHADDPLFRPVDADDFRTNHEQARDFSNLRQNGLVRVVFQLPPTIRLIDPATNVPSAETEVDVWRMVPSVNNVKLTGPDGQNPSPRGPNESGGYQLDGRLATLQEQALGALRAHAEIRNTPSQRVLDDLSSFQRVLFSSPRVLALSAAIDAGVSPLPDPDPRLSALEQQGKAVFTRACGQCHGGPTQSTTPFPIPRFHDIVSQCPRPVDPAPTPRFAFKACEPRLARNARTYEVTLAVPTPTPAGVLPAGTKVRRVSSDPGRAFQTGFVGGPPPFDDWNKFDVPSLRGIAKTAPYFHNNSADTLEEVVDHYIQLFNLIKVQAPPGPPPVVASTDGVTFDRQPKPEERAALLAYLRKL